MSHKLMWGGAGWAVYFWHDSLEGEAYWDDLYSVRTNVVELLRETEKVLAVIDGQRYEVALKIATICRLIIEIDEEWQVNINRNREKLTRDSREYSQSYLLTTIFLKRGGNR